MVSHAPTHIDEPLTIEPKSADKLFGIGLALAIAGLALACLAAIFLGGLRRFMLSYLTAFMFLLTISIGALFFVLIMHAFKAGWSVNVRRVPELLTRLFWPTLPVLALPIVIVTLFIPGTYAADGEGNILSTPNLYPWAAHQSHGEEVDDLDAVLTPDEQVEAAKPEDGASDALDADGIGQPGIIPTEPYEDLLVAQAITVERARHHLHIDELTEKKTAFLNRPFFVVRVAIYFAVWAFIAHYYFRRSTEQDATGEPRLTKEMTAASYGFLVLFGVVTTFAAFDLVMSLDPHFFSTIFGVYIFAGGVLGCLATTILAYQFMRMGGLLRQSVTVEHYHDLGKLLFAFVFFWGYIAFSQFMLIWYANIPETTYWFGVRGATSVGANLGMGPWGEPDDAAQVGWWTVISLTLLFGHLLIPFAGLLSRHVKRNLTFLGFWAGWMLVMHYVDLYWLIMPEMLGVGSILPITEVGCLLFVAGVGLAMFGRELKAVRLRPAGDPRAVESLAFHNM